MTTERILSQSASCVNAQKRMIDAFLRGSYRKRCFTDGQFLYVVSIRKIQTGLDRRHRADKLRSDVYTLLAKRPPSHPLGLLPLCLGLRVNQVG